MGGGLHQTIAGGSLSLHCDFAACVWDARAVGALTHAPSGACTRALQTNALADAAKAALAAEADAEDAAEWAVMYRRVNVFVFLNDEWDDAWGGELELYDSEAEYCAAAFAPRGNRVVVFTTGPAHWHGHPTPLRCPPHRSRRSIALYYYARAPHPPPPPTTPALRACADAAFCGAVLGCGTREACEAAEGPQPDGAFERGELQIDATSWRRCAAHAAACGGAPASRAATRGDIYAFGVYRGTSLLELGERVFPEAVRLWAFDSFTGLPDSAAAEGHPDWAAGSFRAAEDASAAEHLIASLTARLGGPARLGVVRGYFNESLRRGLAAAHGMRPARYVDIDVDLYSSTIDALEWLFDEGLVVPGTLIGYDN